MVSVVTGEESVVSGKEFEKLLLGLTTNVYVEQKRQMSRATNNKGIESLPSLVSLPSGEETRLRRFSQRDETFPIAPASDDGGRASPPTPCGDCRRGVASIASLRQERKAMAQPSCWLGETKRSEEM
uniref:Uncharacterized protein n=1 Tax=Globodera rostochiensis TaxID=31243 RepID=A0A914HLR4_GLORO